MPEDIREDQVVSERLRIRARVLPGDREVCWTRDDIEAALREVADAGYVILGFDILEPLSGGEFQDWGTSAYDIGPFLNLSLGMNASRSHSTQQSKTLGTRTD